MGQQKQLQLKGEWCQVNYFSDQKFFPNFSKLKKPGGFHSNSS
jgi:hypothetical protein